MSDVRLRDLNPAQFNYGVNIAGSVGIGTTSPGYELEVVAAANSAEIGIKGTSGNNALVVFKEVGDIKGFVGIEGSTDILKLVTGATFGGSVKGINIDSSGFVGIGTTAPGDILEAAGAGRSMGSTNRNVAKFESTTSNKGGVMLGGTSYGVNDSALIFPSVSTGSLILNVGLNGDTLGMAIQSNGLVGIGTTTPKRSLHIHTSSAASCFLQVTNGSTGSSSDGDGFQFGIGSTGGAQIIQRENLPLTISTNNTERLIISAVGEVGIGTASPGEKLHLVTGGNTRIRIDSGDSSASSVDLYDNGSLGVRINCDSTKNLELMAGGRTGADMIVLASNGNVGIGTTSPTETLHVNGNLKVTGTVDVGSSGFSVSSGFVLPFAGGTAPSGWLACSGQAVSRTTYSDLFAIIGVIYGAGDGSTTFNVPDSRGRIIMGDEGNTALRTPDDLESVGDTGGSQTHVLTTEEIPAHKHFMSLTGGCDDDNCAGGYGAYRVMSNRRWYDHANQVTKNTGGGGAHNNIQPSIVMMHIIKT